MRLIIAEKKSLADAIAAALPNAKKEKMCITSGDDVVTWSVGHILRQKKPEELDPAYKSWENKDILPIIPDFEDMLVPEESTMAVFNNIRALLKKADVVVNAGDADREGQLLIDEILKYCGYKGKVYRLLLTDLSPDAIKKSLGIMKPNETYYGIYEAGLGRQRADWLVGMNLSRVYTITTERTFGKSISVGRVQTPTLALVVNRDREIENFTAKPYYEVYGDFTVNGEDFRAKWQPFGLKKDKKERGEEEIIDRPGFDETGRIVAETVISDLQVKVEGRGGRICGYKRAKEKAAPQAPFSLPQLEIEASKRYGLAPKETLAICQKLYEAKILTYPRSDCSYLPMSIYNDRERLIAAVINMLEGSIDGFDKIKGLVDSSLKHPCFNDSKVEEHFAIIPTGSPIKGDITANDRKILDLVFRRFLSLFMPAAEYLKTEIAVEVEAEYFKASSKVKTYDGWKALYGSEKEEDEEDDEEETSAILPATQEGAETKCCAIGSNSKMTKPPKRYTEASLLQAMNNVHNFVADPQIKAVLKEKQGIGTAATQAAIIAELIDKRGFICKKGKSLISTDSGRKLIDNLSAELTTPDMTALWEMQLDDIAHNKEQLKDFINDVVLLVRDLVKDRLEKASVVSATGASSGAAGLKHADCPVCGKKDGMRLLDGKFGKYWKCDCGFTSNGAAVPKAESCPFCNGIMVKKKSQKGGYYWKCNNQECGCFLPDEKGKPAKVTFCPKCRQLGKDAVAVRHIKRDGKGYYWKCQSCGSFFTDNKGSLAPKM